MGPYSSRERDFVKGRKINNMKGMRDRQREAENGEKKVIHAEPVRKEQGKRREKEA